MKTKLIQTKDYLLFIDEEAEIKEDDYLYDKLTSHYAGIHQHSGVEYENSNAPNIIQCKSGTTASISRSSKVIAYYPLNSEAKELDLPLLPNPFREVDIEKLAQEYTMSIFGELDDFIDITEGYKAGYKAAQPRQFSLEDMEEVYYQGRIDSSDNEHNFDNFIQSLSTQQLPKEFVISDKFSTFEENIKNGKYKW